MKKLSFAEIEEVFQSWRIQAMANEPMFNLWNALQADLRMLAEAGETVEEKMKDQN